MAECVLIFCCSLPMSSLQRGKVTCREGGKEGGMEGGREGRREGSREKEVRATPSCSSTHLRDMRQDWRLLMVLWRYGQQYTTHED